MPIPDADLVQVPVAMAAPGCWEIAGRLAEGAVTWMTGPATRRDHIAPHRNAAAGNPAPRICVGAPTAVTDHPQRARARADRLFQHYAARPVIPAWGG